MHPKKFLRSRKGLFVLSVLAFSFVVAMLICGYALQNEGMMMYDFTVTVQSENGSPIQGATLKVYAKTNSGSTVLWQTVTSNPLGQIEIYTVNPNYQYITSWECSATGFQTRSGNNQPPATIIMNAGTSPTPTPSNPASPTPPASSPGGATPTPYQPPLDLNTEFMLAVGFTVGMCVALALVARFLRSRRK